MPYKIVKNKNGTFRVINKDNGKIKSKATTLKKAKKQIRLLYMLERNPNMVLSIRKTPIATSNNPNNQRTKTRKMRGKGKGKKSTLYSNPRLKQRKTNNISQVECNKLIEKTTPSLKVLKSLGCIS
jgi:hypothetical protein